MKNLRLGLLLHFYQPYWQFPQQLLRIASECYKPILKIVEEMPGFCFSANINYSLFHLLNHIYLDFKDGTVLFRDLHPVIDGFKKAVEEKKIELLGSTAYHPIMPLIPRELQLEHMRTDTRSKKIIWDIERNCDGIFLPEMACSKSILPNLKECGYNWTVLEDTLFKFRFGYVPFSHVFSSAGFKLFLRSSLWSNRISFENLSFEELREKMSYEIPQWTGDRPAYIILAMDAETFGHHHGQLLERFLHPLIKEWGGNKGILTPIEKIGRIFPVQELNDFPDGSWSTSVEDCRRNNPFPLWNSPNNIAHFNLWSLVNMALKYFDMPEARQDCLKITTSCNFWWISDRSNWAPELMEITAIKAFYGIIKRYGIPEEVLEAKRIFDKLDSLK